MPLDTLLHGLFGNSLPKRGAFLPDHLLAALHPRPARGRLHGIEGRVEEGLGLGKHLLLETLTVAVRLLSG